MVAHEPGANITVALARLRTAEAFDKTFALLNWDLVHLLIGLGGLRKLGQLGMLQSLRQTS